METPDFMNLTYKSKMSNFDWYMEVSIIALLLSIILIHFAWWHMKNVLVKNSEEEEEICCYQDELYTKDRKESFPFLQHMAKQSMFYVFPVSSCLENSKKSTKRCSARREKMLLLRSHQMTRRSQC